MAISFRKTSNPINNICVIGMRKVLHGANILYSKMAINSYSQRNACEKHKLTVIIIIFNTKYTKGLKSYTDH